MASIVDTLPVTTRWNEATAVFVAHRMLMGERRPIERVVQFLVNIERLVDEDTAATRSR